MTHHDVFMHVSKSTGGGALMAVCLICRVVATCRNPDGAAELQELQSMHPDQLSIVQMDCTNEGSIAEAARQVSGSHSHLDLLLNVAGILHIPGKMSPGVLAQC